MFVRKAGGRTVAEVRDSRLATGYPIKENWIVAMKVNLCPCVNVLVPRRKRRNRVT